MLNAKEQELANKLKPLIIEYESESDSNKRATLFKQICAIRPVSEFDLNCYYEGCSLDEFCNRLAVNVVRGVDLSREDAIQILKRLCQAVCDDSFDEFEYLNNKYSEAIRFVFRKQKDIIQLIYEEDKSYDQVLAYYESDEGGPILL